MSHRERPRVDRFNPRQPEHDHFVFEGIDFPATREDLIRYVTDAESDRDVQNLVRSLPDRTYSSRDDVWRSIGEATRMLGGGMRNVGTPRDDIGKQATSVHETVREP